MLHSPLVMSCFERGVLRDAPFFRGYLTPVRSSEILFALDLRNPASRKPLHMTPAPFGASGAHKVLGFSAGSVVTAFFMLVSRPAVRARQLMRQKSPAPTKDNRSSKTNWSVPD